MKVRLTYYVKPTGNRMTWIGEIDEDVLGEIIRQFEDYDGVWSND